MASYSRHYIKGIMRTKQVPDNVRDTLLLRDGSLAMEYLMSLPSRDLPCQANKIISEQKVEQDKEIEFTKYNSDGKIDLSQLNISGGTMQNEVRKKVLLDLFVSPLSLGPIVVGLTTLMASWVFGSVTTAFLGLCAVIIGVGLFTTRLIYGIDEITKAAYESLQKQREDERNKILDALDEALRKDRDPRPEQCLRELRVLHDMLKSESHNTVCGTEILTNFEMMFDVCLKKIQRTDDLWRSSRNLHQTAKQKFIDEREEIVKELLETTEHLSGIY
jgi:hypothetical protein